MTNQIEFLERQNQESTEQELPTAKVVVEAKKVEDIVAKVSFNPAPQYATKEEAIKAFKKLLADNNVQSDWDWPKTMKKIINDVRYKALKTVEERKAIFEEYIEQRRKQEEEERRQREKRLKDDFMLLLSECKQITSRSSYRKIVPLIENDHRFQAIDSDIQRRDYYEEFLYQLAKKERESSSNARRESMDNFRKLLQEQTDKGLITYKSVWRKVRELLKGMDAFEKIDKVDRMVVWDNFIRELQHKEEERRERERKERKKIERKNREIFWVTNIFDYFLIF